MTTDTQNIFDKMESLLMEKTCGEIIDYGPTFAGNVGMTLLAWVLGAYTKRADRESMLAEMLEWIARHADKADDMFREKGEVPPSERIHAAEERKADS